MATILHLHDIVKFAIVKEQESLDLYKKLSGWTKDEQKHKLFTRLTQEEQNHIELFEKLLTEIKDKQPIEIPDDEEHDAYTKELCLYGELVASKRHNVPLDIINNLKFSDALDFAISRETDALLFYLRLNDCIPIEAKQYLEPIINEERKHITMLKTMQ